MRWVLLIHEALLRNLITPLCDVVECRECQDRLMVSNPS